MMLELVEGIPYKGTEEDLRGFFRDIEGTLSRLVGLPITERTVRVAKMHARARFRKEIEEGFVEEDIELILGVIEDQNKLTVGFRRKPAPPDLSEIERWWKDRWHQRWHLGDFVNAWNQGGENDRRET